MKSTQPICITECPRDAMQGWKTNIPTNTKIDYMNRLMKVGFDVLDCGSFVHPKLIPQMADSKEVLTQINRSDSKTKLSVIAANIKGAEIALSVDNVDFIGYPFSISETFQMRNTNKGRENAFEDVQKILNMVNTKNKGLILYFSMAFGNPYQEEWSIAEVQKWAKRFSDIGVKTIMLSDTTGVSTSEIITDLFQTLISTYPHLDFGAHFHNLYVESYDKLKTAYDAGCRRFDTAIKGIGGCPFAKYEFVGNIPTEQLINFLNHEKIDHELNVLQFESAYNQAKDIFKF